MRRPPCEKEYSSLNLEDLDVKSVKVYQVLGVDLVGVEHHKDPGIPGVVHAAVIQVYIAAVFGGRAHCGKIIFHEIGPWCQKGWGLLI